jgi:aspartate aminotransferase-like enzyme
MYGLRESLKMVFEEGYEARVQRHRRLGRITRAGYLGMGLELLADPAYYSNTVTAVKFPASVKDKDFADGVRGLGILVAGGQGPLKGKIFRTNHMNVCIDRDILTTMAVVEVTLKRLGAKIKLGAGVAAAEEQLLKDLKQP